MAITITRDSASIGTTEYFLASDSTSATYQTTDYALQVKLDLTNMAAGDEYSVKFYDKADGTNARLFYQANLVGAQTPVVWVSPTFVVGDWEVSVTKVAGTDRTIYWELAKLA